MSATVQAPSFQRWSRLLTWHLAVVIVASIAVAVLSALPVEFVLTPAGALVAGLVGAPAAVLGLPWSGLLPFAYVDLGPLDWLWSAALFLPPFVNVALHQRLLVWLRSRPARDPAPATPIGPGAQQPTAGPVNPSGSADHRVATRVLAFGACALVGAGLWGAWLGWDTTLYTTADNPEPQGPYTTAQVVACAVSVGVVTAVLARWRDPVVVAGGITFGFWVPWSAQAAAGPLSGVAVGGGLSAAALRPSRGHRHHSRAGLRLAALAHPDPRAARTGSARAVVAHRHRPGRGRRVLAAGGRRGAPDPAAGVDLPGHPPRPARHRGRRRDGHRGRPGGALDRAAGGPRGSSCARWRPRRALVARWCCSRW